MREDSREECKLEYEKLVLADSPQPSHLRQARELIQWNACGLSSQLQLAAVRAFARKASFLTNAEDIVGVTGTSQRFACRLAH